MKNVRPLLKKDFVKIIASWPIVRWTVPRLLIFYVWVLPFLTMCRHFRFREPSRNSSRVAALADC